MTSAHPERSAEIDVSALNRDPSQSVTKSEAFFFSSTMSTLFLERLCVPSVLLLFKVFEGKARMQGDKKGSETPDMSPHGKTRGF